MKVTDHEGPDPYDGHTRTAFAPGRVLIEGVIGDGQRSEVHRFLEDDDGTLLARLGPADTLSSECLVHPRSGRIAIWDADTRDGLEVWDGHTGERLARAATDNVLPADFELHCLDRLAWCDEDTVAVLLQPETREARQWRACALLAGHTTWRTVPPPADPDAIGRDLAGPPDEPVPALGPLPSRPARSQPPRKLPPVLHHGTTLSLPEDQRQRVLDALLDALPDTFVAGAPPPSRSPRRPIWIVHAPTGIVLVPIPWLSGPILLGRTPVTRAQWGASPDDDLPMTGRTPLQIEDWLSTHGDLRLPREEEWLHAVRGTATTEFWWGKRWKAKRGWSADNAVGPQPVGAHAASPHGLLDVHGNVAEVLERDLGNGYLARGGSFRRPGAACGLSHREGVEPDEARDDLGFRVAALWSRDAGHRAATGATA